MCLRACDTRIRDELMRLSTHKGPFILDKKRTSPRFLPLHAVNSKLESLITSYVIGFAGPMKALNTLNSIDNDQNIA